jgi:hypothetical protein
MEAQPGKPASASLLQKYLEIRDTWLDFQAWNCWIT